MIFLKYILRCWLSHSLLKVIEIRKMTSCLNGQISQITPILSLAKYTKQNQSILKISKRQICKQRLAWILILWDILYWVDCIKTLWTKFPNQNTIIKTTVSHQLCKPCCNKLYYCFCPSVCAEIEHFCKWLKSEIRTIFGFQNQKEVKGSGGMLKSMKTVVEFLTISVS